MVKLSNVSSVHWSMNEWSQLNPEEAATSLDPEDHRLRICLGGMSRGVQPTLLWVAKETHQALVQHVDHE